MAQQEKMPASILADWLFRLADIIESEARLRTAICDDPELFGMQGMFNAMESEAKEIREYAFLCKAQGGQVIMVDWNAPCHIETQKG